MKRSIIILAILAFVVSACAPKSTPTAGTSLQVTLGDSHKTYTVADLESLGKTQATFKGVTYIGVPLSALLKNAGFNPADLSAVKAVATDGFSANYDPSLFNKADTILAYARADGPLTSDELPFAMVLPGEGGKLNVRMVAEIDAIP